MSGFGDLSMGVHKVDSHIRRFANQLDAYEWAVAKYIPELREPMTGFNMPRGVSPSDIPGNRPEELEAEAASETLYDGFYRATRTGFTVKEIENEWRAAAEEAVRDEESDLENEMAYMEETEQQMEDERRLRAEREERELHRYLDPEQ